MPLKLLPVFIVLASVLVAGCEWSPHKPAVKDKSDTTTETPATPPAADAPGSGSTAPAPKNP